MISSVAIPTQSCMALSSASTLLAAVCATTPGDTSLKIRFVIAWRIIRRKFISSTWTAFEISAKVAVEPTGNAFAGFVRQLTRPAKYDELGEFTHLVMIYG
jgi:hypothetical protein